jgi:hypothetical protein
MRKAMCFLKRFGTHTSLVLDTTKAKLHGMPILLAKRQASGPPSLSPLALGRSTQSCPVQWLGCYLAPTPIHDFVVLFLPPCGPHSIPFGHQVHRAEPTCISTPWRPLKAKTFRTRSSPAPTQIKLQSAPAILDQDSVLTTLSITHHTKEQPSTGPRTLRSSTVEAGTAGVTAGGGALCLLLCSIGEWRRHFSF